VSSLCPFDQDSAVSIGRLDFVEFRHPSLLLVDFGDLFIREADLRNPQSVLRNA
jgi:hypothetical protein